MTLRATMRDARALGYCAAGVRRFCERHGLSFAEFVADGLPLERLRAIDDGAAQRLADYVEAHAAA